MNQIQLSERLTKANRLFLEFIADGVPVGEAYRKAGYKGEIKNAYDLKLKLKGELAKVLEVRGFSREGVLIELGKLNGLPLKDEAITIDQKLRLYKLVLETLPDRLKSASRETIQPFVIVRSDNTVIQTGESSKDLGNGQTVVDAEVISVPTRTPTISGSPTATPAPPTTPK